MKPRVVWGIFLILLGSVFLLETAGIVNSGWDTLWPLFLFVAAAAFHLGAFTGGKRNAGLLVPGGILLVISLLFFYHNVFGWENAEYTWPFYLFAVAFGLFELFLFGEREWGLLIPVVILTGIGVMFYLDLLISWEVVWSIILIGIGLSILFGDKKRKKHPPDHGKKAS